MMIRVKVKGLPKCVLHVDENAQQDPRFVYTDGFENPRISSLIYRRILFFLRENQRSHAKILITESGEILEYGAGAKRTVIGRYEKVG